MFRQTLTVLVKLYSWSFIAEILANQIEELDRLMINFSKIKLNSILVKRNESLS